MFNLFKSSSNELPAQWHTLNELGQLKDIDSASTNKPQVIMKHSTRCSISSAALHRLNQGVSQLAEQADVHYLDLISHREVSNEIERHYGVRHESPQVLVIENGKVSRHLSHNAIRPEAVLEG